jgi:hypothetical protein
MLFVIFRPSIEILNSSVCQNMLINLFLIYICQFSVGCSRGKVIGLQIAHNASSKLQFINTYYSFIVC